MANLKLKTLPVFPTKVQGTGGIGVNKESGVYTIEPEWDDLTLAASISANDMQVWVRDATDSTYKRVALSTLIASITAPIFVQNDAPDTGETEGSIWIDADSTDADLYQLVSGVWTDTTANLRGPQGIQGNPGVDGSLIFVQNDAPDTGNPEGSIWIDADSTNQDLYQLTSGSWVDTGVNVKGADGLGTGDVVGPASSTDGSLARFDGTDGKLLKDGAVIGADVQAYDADTAKTDVAQSWTAKQTFATTTKLQQTLEKWNIVADNLAAGDNNIDVLTASAWLYTAAGDTNAVLNVRGDASNSLNSIMDTGDSITVAVVLTHTGTAYYVTSVKIDGSAVTVEWLEGVAPAAGSRNALDAYIFTIIKTASATFTVLGQKTKFS